MAKLPTHRSQAIITASYLRLHARDTPGENCEMFGPKFAVCQTIYEDTVVARLSARALINFTALLPLALVQNRRLFETRRLMFSVLKVQFIHQIIVSHRPIIYHWKAYLLEI